MIKSLKLINFQCHENREFNFSPKFTAITGPSDSGKSSIRRAIYWVLRDLRKQLIYKYWDKKNKTAQVCLTFVDKDSKEHELVRERDRAGYVNDWVLDGTRYQKPGGVPSILQTIIPDSGIKVDEKELDICLGHQNDGFFLVDESPQGRALLLDTMTGIIVTDKAIKETRKDLQQNETDQIQTKTDIANTKQTLTTKSVFIQYQQDLSVLQNQCKTLNNQEQHIDELKQLIEHYNSIQKALSRIIPFEVPNIISIKDTLLQLIKLNTIVNKYKSIQKRLQAIVPITIPQHDLPKLRASLFKANQISTLILRHQTLTKQISIAKNTLQSIETSLITNRTELSKIPLCPKCGRPFNG